MKLTDTIVIEAAQQRIWDALNDPVLLLLCIEGCTRLEQRDDGAFDGTVQAKIGPVRASFQGIVTISAADPPNSYTLHGEGKGGVAGFAKGSASVTLKPVSPAQTELGYEVNASVGGKLAQLGARLIEATAKDYADKFFTRFKAVVEASTTPEATPDRPVAGAQNIAAREALRPGLPGWLWPGLVIAVLSAMVWYFARHA